MNCLFIRPIGSEYAHEHERSNTSLCVCSFHGVAFILSAYPCYVDFYSWFQFNNKNKMQYNLKKLDRGAVALAIFFLIALAGPVASHAAVTPSLGVAATYGVLGSTYTNTSVTTINGDVGFTTPPATIPLGTHTNYGSGAPYATAGIDQATALITLNSQPCDFTFSIATDLSLLPQPLAPGVYCVTGAQSVGTGGITLTPGTYNFRSTGALNTAANSSVVGGSACDIFWTPTATTLGANSTFLGTVIDPSGITVGAVTSWSGRALAFGGTVTTDTNTITAPTCVPIFILLDTP